MRKRISTSIIERMEPEQTIRPDEVMNKCNYLGKTRTRQEKIMNNYNYHGKHGT